MNNDHTSASYENFVIKLTDACKTHEEWLSVVSFGLGSLLYNQPLLIEIMAREAQRECDRFNSHGPTDIHASPDHMRGMLDELGLKLIVENGY